MEFDKLLDEAVARQKTSPSLSTFVALKQIARERKIDLTQFFPNINIESALKNVEKRNDILLNELLSRSKSKLQLGLDLKGGVAVTLEVDSKAAGEDPANIRQEKLTKAIEIISARINSFGVARPSSVPWATTASRASGPASPPRTTPRFSPPSRTPPRAPVASGIRRSRRKTRRQAKFRLATR